MSKDINNKMMQKRSLYSHEIRDLIKEAVINEELKPGERVVETRWAKKLGVSQAPVREAIRELEVMGLIENRPYQGAFVREIDKKEIIDSYRVRIALEILAMQYAIKLITEQQLNELSDLLNEMKQAAQDGSFDLFIEKDNLFHRKIIEVTQNRILMILWEQCQIREFVKINSATSSLGLKVLAERHGKLFQALKMRDENMAVAEVRKHFELLIHELKDMGKDKDIN